jgi:hypothetical protein
MRVLPIAHEGNLTPNASFVLLGYMYYPEDERSAEQLAVLLAEESADFDYEIPTCELTKAVHESLPQALLSLMGELAICVATNIASDGKPLISRAAHLVSENQSTNTTVEGKPLPTTPRRIRETFTNYSSVAHFWAADRLTRETNSSGELKEFLACANMFLSKFQSSRFEFEYDPWTSPVIGRPTIYEWPADGLIENPKQVEALLASYRSRSGRD